MEIKVKLSDVAELAGVSIATASKALNNRSGVHFTTRKRVIDAAEQLEFVTTYNVARYSFYKSGSVGLITDDLDGRFILPILAGIEERLGFQNVATFLCDSRGDIGRESFQIKSLLQKKIDGLIVVGSSLDFRASFGPDFPVPVIYAYAPSERDNDISVITDNEGSAGLAAEHLINIGRKKIAHIAGKQSSRASHLRLRGFKNTLAKQGLKMVTDDPLYGDWLESWGRTATLKLLKAGLSLDAFFCGNDQIARGCIETLQKNNIKVPSDIAVIGFDNWDVVVSGCKPQITSVDMNLQDLGGMAAQKLINMIHGQREIGTQKIPGALIIRGSTWTA